MRFRSIDSPLHKTLAFAAIHLVIAVSVGWLFTGGFVLGGLLALLEPSLNTVVIHRIETWTRHWRGNPRLALAKSALMGASHLAVATGVGYALTGSWAAAGGYALVEPLANMVAYYFFDRWWQRQRLAAAAA